MKLSMFLSMDDKRFVNSLKPFSSLLNLNDFLMKTSLSFIMEVTFVILAISIPT